MGTERTFTLVCGLSLLVLLGCGNVGGGDSSLQEKQEAPKEELPGEEILCSVPKAPSYISGDGSAVIFDVTTSILQPRAFINRNTGLLTLTFDYGDGDLQRTSYLNPTGREVPGTRKEFTIERRCAVKFKIRMRDRNQYFVGEFTTDEVYAMDETIAKAKARSSDVFNSWPTSIYSLRKTHNVLSWNIPMQQAAAVAKASFNNIPSSPCVPSEE